MLIGVCLCFILALPSFSRNKTLKARAQFKLTAIQLVACNSVILKKFTYFLNVHLVSAWKQLLLNACDSPVHRHSAWPTRASRSASSLFTGHKRQRKAPDTSRFHDDNRVCKVLTMRMLRPRPREAHWVCQRGVLLQDDRELRRTTLASCRRRSTSRASRILSDDRTLPCDRSFLGQWLPDIFFFFQSVDRQMPWATYVKI